jgi:SAM-dependent methyltransferase
LDCRIVLKRAQVTLLREFAHIRRLLRLPEHRKQSREPDVPFQPSPKPAVKQMLRLAGVDAGDVVYDLGCGDGRIPIAASQLCGARGVGIDIDPQRIEESLRNARDEGVLDRVTFRNEDFFEANISDATVVTLFLWPEVNLELRTKLRRELKPGTRVVSYCWEVADWVPEQETAVDGRPIYLWTIPARAPRAARRTMRRS